MEKIMKIEKMWDFLYLKRTKLTTVCLVLYKWAVHTTACVTRKRAGVGHLALYLAWSSLRAAKRLMQGFSRPTGPNVSNGFSQTCMCVCRRFLYVFFCIIALYYTRLSIIILNKTIKVFLSLSCLFKSSSWRGIS